MNKLIFRKKDLLENGTLIDPQSINKDQTFIKQILDIDRFQKNEIVEEAIIDYLCRDIEIAHLINSSSPLTREDFKKFLSQIQDVLLFENENHYRKNAGKFLLVIIN